MALPKPVAAVPPEVASSRAPFRWFIASTASWFGATGLQMVLFQGLLIDVLDETPMRIGIAQSALMLPPVLLLMIGGAVADRRDRRMLLVALHLLAATFVVGLGALIYYGRLTYGALIGFALLMGCVTAFVVPARDSMLSEPLGHILEIISPRSFAIGEIGFVLLLKEAFFIHIAPRRSSCVTRPHPSLLANSSGAGPSTRHARSSVIESSDQRWGTSWKLYPRIPSQLVK